MEVDLEIQARVLQGRGERKGRSVTYASICTPINVCMHIDRNRDRLTDR